MADFNTFFPTLLQHEGGFVDNPNDPGGATNKGITMGTFKAQAEPVLGMEPTLANLKALTDAQAGAIYKKIYWDRIYGDQIPNQDLADMLFDFYVNAGGNAVKTLQRTINSLNDGGAQIAVDGGMGPNTLKAMNALNTDELYMAYKNARKQYYIDLADRNPKLKVFLKGWLNRVNSFPDLP